jgi:hypothetical protein
MPSGKRGPGLKKAAVERREARFLDRKRKRHASQACWVTSPVTREPRKLPRFPALRFPFGGVDEKAQPARHDKRAMMHAHRLPHCDTSVICRA